MEGVSCRSIIQQMVNCPYFQLLCLPGNDSLLTRLRVDEMLQLLHLGLWARSTVDALGEETVQLNDADAPLNDLQHGVTVSRQAGMEKMVTKHLWFVVE